MANLIIEIPDDLTRSLERIACSRHMTVQELAVEQLRSFVAGSLELRAGSPAAVLRTMSAPPHLRAADIEALEAAISSGRTPVQTRDLYSG